jgi:hypothetical protein
MIVTICDVNKIVEPGKFYVCWSAVSTDVSNRLIRADMLFLNVVFKYENETYFRRIRGYKQYGDSGPDMVWTLKRRYRITQGERKGMIVPLSEVRDDEVFIESGVSKVLLEGNDSKRLSKKRKNDQVIINLLSNIEERIEVVDLVEHLPYLYLTCKPNNTQLYLRRVGSAQSMIRSHPEYDPSVSSQANIRKLRKDYRTDVGNERVGYPFDMIYGSGVLAAPIKSKETNMVLGQWYKVDQNNFACGKFIQGVTIEGDLKDALNSRPDNT